MVDEFVEAFVDALKDDTDRGRVLIDAELTSVFCCSASCMWVRYKSFLYFSSCLTLELVAMGRRDETYFLDAVGRLTPSGGLGCAMGSINLALRAFGPDLGALWLNWDSLE